MHICRGPKSNHLFVSLHPSRVCVPTRRLLWHRTTIPFTRTLDHGAHGIIWYQDQEPPKWRTCLSVFCPLLRNSGERKRTSETCGGGLIAVLAQTQKLVHKTWWRMWRKSCHPCTSPKMPRPVKLVCFTCKRGKALEGAHRWVFGQYCILIVPTNSTYVHTYAPSFLPSFFLR